MWSPFPEDEIPKELQSVIASLAEHAHERWAQQRIRDGWTWGPERNDEARTHPCLVPYADLCESEREYDRQVVTGTLKALVKLGFRIARDGSG
jgi:hypothetical protein